MDRHTDTGPELHCGFYQQPALTLKAGSWRKKRANYITLTQAVLLFFLGVSKKRRLSFLWRCSWSQSVVKSNWLVRPNWPGRDTHEPKLSKNCERKESSAFWSKEHLNSGRSLGYVSLARQTSEPHALLLPLLKRSEHQARSGGERKGCLHSMPETLGKGVSTVCQKPWVSCLHTTHQIWDLPKSSIFPVQITGG